MVISNNDKSMPDFRVGSLNCNGLGGAEKREKVINWLKGKLESVICLQETHAVPETEHLWKKDWDGGNIYFSHGTSNSTGVAILIKKDSGVDPKNSLIQSPPLLGREGGTRVHGCFC